MKNDSTEMKLRDIQAHPEHHHHDFFDLQRCYMVNGSFDPLLMDAHPALGRNGGQKCDVTSGPMLMRCVALNNIYLDSSHSTR